MENSVKVSKRICAYLLDILFVYLVISLIMGIKFLNPTYDKYMEYMEKYNTVAEEFYNGDMTSEEFLKQNNDNFYYVTKYSVSYNVVIVLSIIGYFVVFQKFNNGQTLGRKIMKIKLVRNDDKDVTLLDTFIRTLSMYYIYIGSIIPLVLNSILVFIIPKSKFLYINMGISYIFVGIAIASLVMIWIRKDKKGLQDIISKTKVVEE